MPATQVFFYKDDREVPVKDWLAELRKRDRKGFAKCVVRLLELAKYGHELRRPAADILQAGIYELRAKHGHVQYRILYFFHGRNVTVLAHAIVKEGAEVPQADVRLAAQRRDRLLRDPAAHLLELEIEQVEGSENG